MRFHPGATFSIQFLAAARGEQVLVSLTDSGQIEVTLPHGNASFETSADDRVTINNSSAATLDSDTSAAVLTYVITVPRTASEVYIVASGRRLLLLRRGSVVIGPQPDSSGRLSVPLVPRM
jgi:hypothetical protein